MGHTEEDETADDLEQFLLEAERNSEHEVAPQASTSITSPVTPINTQPVVPSLRESDAFATDLQTGTTATDTDDGAQSSSGGVTVTSTTPNGRKWMGFSDAAKRSVDRPTQSAESSSSTSRPSIIAATTDALDSSDDEDAANFLQRKYNEYGAGISGQLKKQQGEQDDRRVGFDVDQSIRNLRRTASTPSRAPGIQPTPHEFPAYVRPNLGAAPTAAKPSSSSSVQPQPFAAADSTVGVYTDPVFGLRIVHPLISSASLQQRMVGRTAVTVSGLQTHLTRLGGASKQQTQPDWAIAGVIVTKGAIQTSKKGSQYVIWKLCDMRPDMRQVSVFLFKGACKDLWKTAQGVVVAILNPGEMDNSKAGELTLSVDTASKVMVLGQSKDLGTCKARKKNGDACTAIVNRHACQYCVFHVKQEYGKMAGREELQSATSGRGLQSLRNKVLGKSEVFYGGQSFMATPTLEPARKNAKLVANDQKRIMTLSEYYQSSLGTATTTTMDSLAKRSTPARSRVAATVETNTAQRLKDLERLQRLDDEQARFQKNNAEKAAATTAAAAASATPSTSAAVNGKSEVPARFRNLTFSAQATRQPVLKSDGFNLDANVGPGTSPISQRQAALNKAKALAILSKTPIAASNPNFIKHRGTEAGRKRAADELAARQPDQLKKQKITDEAERFRRERIDAIINAKSSHADLVEAKELDAQAKYFETQEKKEAMEEKMLGTFSMPCKAVTCLKCRYTAFSASDNCKAEKHPLKVIDAEKRFFECSDCGSRTATVHRMPKTTCKNCQGSRWKRTAMIKDRCAEVGGEKLSIRGDEESFIGAVVSGGNLNLCVAAED